MFENYVSLPQEEKNRVKELYRAVRALTYVCVHKSKLEDIGGRYRNLIWAYVRGFHFRRVERTHRVEIRPDGSTFTHNMPYVPFIAGTLQSLGAEVTAKEIEAWLADPSGAIDPPPRPVRQESPVEGYVLLREARRERRKQHLQSLQNSTPTAEER